MKKSIQILKTIVAVTIVLVMAQGCVPAGGNPTPTPNGFNINISSYTLDYPNPNNSQSKTLYIDGDSLLFTTNVWIGAMGGAVHNFTITPMSSNLYEYMANFYSATVYNSNVVIGINNLDSINKWKNISETQNKIYFGSSSFLWPNNILDNILPPNTERYIVFRKLKSVGYQYYWVKMIYAHSNSTINEYRLNILNGKYQTNSIVTGQ